MSKRHLVVVDLETTGLDHTVHVPIEVAAMNADTGESLAFVPYLDPLDLSRADGDALRINRYFERGVYRQALTREATSAQYTMLWKMLEGNTLAGANPRFDAQMLMRTSVFLGGVEPWHYRLADVSSYVAGALGVYPSALPGLHDCCVSLSVTNDTPHSADSDVKAAVACFRKAMDRSWVGAR